MNVWEQPGTIAHSLWNTGKPNCPVYDMHGHMGSYGTIFFQRAEADQMVAHLRRTGVTKLVFSHHHVLHEPTVGNDIAFKACQQFPDELRMYVGINPHFPDNTKRDLAHFDAWQPYAVGIKFLADYHGVPVDSPKYAYALDFANERKLPVLCHTWGGSHNNGADNMLNIAQKYTNVTFFAGHCVFGDWAGAERLVKEAPGNVYLELTAVPGDFALVERLVAAVGSERILFGTDLPWFDEYHAMAGVVTANITEQDKKNILCDNVERILGKNW